MLGCPTNFICLSLCKETQLSVAVLFRASDMANIDLSTVSSFGDEWLRFDQSAMTVYEARKIFNEYFSIFPWDRLPEHAEGFDMGCGSGRWAYWVAPRVGRLHCIDPSGAIEVTQRNLAQFNNVICHRAGVGDYPLPPCSQDFGYSLGVLHHVPDVAAAIRSCAELLKPGAPLLLYIYYAFDHRPKWYQAIWRLTDFMRKRISLLSPAAKRCVTDAIAFFVYLPLAQFSSVLERLGANVASIPLSYYRNCSFYTMRTDARDRFGTPLEQRFTRRQIEEMMDRAGFVDIRFSETAPFWCVVGVKGA